MRHISTHILAMLIPSIIRHHKRLKRLIAGCVIVMLNIAISTHAGANMIRDTEIEHFLLSLARPMAATAGLDANQLQIRVIIDPRFNAFVTGVR